MTSKLAMDDIEALIAEGCVVHPSDVVKLNAIGLRIEKRPDFRLASLPRIAVMGNVIFRQPTIAQDIFLDDARQVLSDDPATNLALDAWVLAHPDECFKKLKHPFWFITKCRLWVKKNLGGRQATQVRRALDYCLFGVDSATGESPVYMTENEIFYELPDEPLSRGEKQFANATAFGLDALAVLRSTSPVLEAMMERAYLLNELKAISQDEKEAIGEYYSTLEWLKKKARAEKEKKELEASMNKDTTEKEEVKKEGETNG
jgi:hypothetical protein